MQSRQWARTARGSSKSAAADQTRVRSGAFADATPLIAVVPLRDAGPTPALEDIQRRVDSALRTAPRALVVDMSSVTAVSSTTVAALLWINRRCCSRGVEPSVRGASRRSLDTMKKVGLLDVMRIEPRTDGG